MVTYKIKQAENVLQMKLFSLTAHSLTILHVAWMGDKTRRQTQNVYHIFWVILDLMEARLACVPPISTNIASKILKSSLLCWFSWITYYGEEKFGISSRYIPKINSTAIFSGVFQNYWIDVNESGVLSKRGSLAEIFPVWPVGRRLFNIPGIVAG